MIRPQHLGKALTIALLALFLFSGIAHADVWVNGYYRSNGTYVNGYYRSSPDGNPYNNYSYPGNYNPYTGETAPGNPDTYLKNYYNSGSSYGGSSGSTYYPSLYTTPGGYNSNYYSVPTPIPTPSCPLMSSYNSASGSCQCYSGYVANGSSCVSGLSYCWSHYGINSSYSYLNKNCECDYGYEYQYGTCTKTTSGTEYQYLLHAPTPTPTPSGSLRCQQKYGIESRYNSGTDTCSYCDTGYFMVGDKCYPKGASVPTPTPIQAHATPSASPKVRLPALPSPATTPKGCAPGKTPTFDGRHCVALPSHSHAVHTVTDAWLCDDGYREVGNACVQSLTTFPTTSPTPKESIGWFARFLKGLF